MGSTYASIFKENVKIMMTRNENRSSVLWLLEKKIAIRIFIYKIIIIKQVISKLFFSLK